MKVYILKKSSTEYEGADRREKRKRNIDCYLFDLNVLKMLMVLKPQKVVDLN